MSKDDENDPYDDIPESDTRLRYITPQIKEAGRDPQTQIRTEYPTIKGAGRT